MKLLSVPAKMSVVLLLVATMVLSAVLMITGLGRYWWISTIIYTVAAALAIGGAAYDIWKHRKPKEKKQEGDDVSGL